MIGSKTSIGFNPAAKFRISHAHYPVLNAQKLQVFLKSLDGVGELSKKVGMRARAGVGGYRLCTMRIKATEFYIINLGFQSTRNEPGHYFELVGKVEIGILFCWLTFRAAAFIVDAY